jgi:hypothetical protein
MKYRIIFVRKSGDQDRINCEPLEFAERIVEAITSKYPDFCHDWEILEDVGDSWVLIKSSWRK